MGRHWTYRVDSVSLAKSELSSAEFSFKPTDRDCQVDQVPGSERNIFFLQNHRSEFTATGAPGT